MKRKVGPPSIYADSLKITIARQYLSGEYSYGQLAEKYALNNAGVARAMVRWYQKHYGQDKIAVAQKERITSVSTPVTSSAVAPKAIVNKDKDKQLQEALLKVEALELLIANAGKELGVDLIKKLGTKQPGK